MKELSDLISAWRALPTGEPAALPPVLATVITTRGSTYRRKGAMMLITPERWQAGSISGGCLESDLVRTAYLRTESGPAVVEFDATAEEDALIGFGLGCQGSTTVLLQRLPKTENVLTTIERHLQERRPIRLGLTTEGEAIGRWRTLSPEDALLPGEIEISIPLPLSLTIFGAGHDAIPVARIAAELGWLVRVVDGRGGFAVRERFPSDTTVLQLPPQKAVSLAHEPGSAIVIMSHVYTTDRDLLPAALRSPATYVGVLGPAVRTRRLLDEIAGKGERLAEEQMAKLHAPIGLDLGSSTPQEIALEIIADLLAWFKETEPRRLSASWSQPLTAR